MKIVIKALEIAEEAPRKIKKLLLRSSNEQFRQIERWYAEDPFDLKRSDFDFLSRESVVFDLGGYVGQWSSDIAARYGSKIFVFEPVSQYATIIRNRFSKNENVVVCPYGLASKSTDALIKIDKFASRLTEKTTDQSSEQIVLREFNSFMKEHGISHIDLIKINIEGAEYDLLDHLIATGTVNNIKAILVQFHNFVDNHAPRRKHIHDKLALTHKKAFDYPYVWELWFRR